MDNVRIPPSDQFVADVKKLMNDLTEYKQFQRSGQDSIRMYRVFSDDAVDKTLTSVGFMNKKFRLTFYPDNGADRGLVYRMEFTMDQSPGGSVIPFAERENVDNEDGSQTWLFIMNGSDFFPTPLVELKFYFWASGTGTFTIEDL